MFKTFVKRVFGWGLWINALVIAPQSISMYTNHSDVGVNPITYSFFAVMQFFGFLRGLHLRDTPMAIGWLLSCLVTLTVVAQIIVYETHSQTAPQTTSGQGHMT